MNLAQAALGGLVVFLCFNFGAWYLHERDIVPIQFINIYLSPADVVDDPSLNATSAATGFGTGIITFYLANILPVLQMVARLMTLSLIGLPAFLFTIGCPIPIALIISALYSICWIVTVGEIIRGFKIGG